MTPDSLDIHWQINTKVDAPAQPALHRAVLRGGCGRVKKRSDARIGHNSVYGEQRRSSSRVKKHLHPWSTLVESGLLALVEKSATPQTVRGTETTTRHDRQFDVRIQRRTPATLRSIVTGDDYSANATQPASPNHNYGRVLLWNDEPTAQPRESTSHADEPRRNAASSSEKKTVHPPRRNFATPHKSEPAFAAAAAAAAAARYENGWTDTSSSTAHDCTARSRSIPVRASSEAPTTRCRRGRARSSPARRQPGPTNSSRRYRHAPDPPHPKHSDAPGLSAETPTAADDSRPHDGLGRRTGQPPMPASRTTRERNCGLSPD